MIVFAARPPLAGRDIELARTGPMHPELFKIPLVNITVPSYGAMMMVGFLAGTWWMARRAARVKADPDIVLNLAFIVLLCSVLGGRTFYVIHYWDSQFAGQPAQIINFRAGGFEFYGGFIGAFIPSVLYLWYKGLSVRLYADLVTPSILLGLGIGRIGCFLFGCCWGGACSPHLPWAARFPYGSPAHQRQWEQRQVTLPAELILTSASGLAAPIPRQVLDLTPEKLAKVEGKLAEAEAALTEARAEEDAAKIEQAEITWNRMRLGLKPLLGHFAKYDTTPAALRDHAARPALASRPVHPTQLYASIGALLLAWLTSAYFYRRKRHGMVMVVGLMLYAGLRFVEEMVRVDNPHDTFGLTISQGISVGILILGIAAYLMLRRFPLRSSRPAARQPVPAPATGSASPAGTAGPA